MEEIPQKSLQILRAPSVVNIPIIQLDLVADMLLLIPQIAQHLSLHVQLQNQVPKLLHAHHQNHPTSQALQDNDPKAQFQELKKLPGNLSMLPNLANLGNDQPYMQDTTNLR